MSLRRSPSSGPLGYGMPMGMGSETSTLQIAMNADQSDAVFPLDTSFLYPFDGTAAAAMSLDAGGGPLPASFDAGPGPGPGPDLVSPDALVPVTGRAPYPPDGAAAGANPPRETAGP
ncbi:hypothetical protein VTH06DRAFT_880, partial [Thermothelomyces fergusii]